MQRVVIEVPESSDASVSAFEVASESNSDASRISIKTAPDAFKALIDETIIYALNKDYTQSMSVMQALVDVFCEADKFSWAKTAKLSGAVTIGVLCGIFAINSNVIAMKILQEAIKQQTGADISYENILLRLLQIGNVSGSTALATTSAMSLINTYFGSSSEAENFLKKYPQGECGETFKSIGKKTLSLFIAIAANVPVYFVSQPSGIPIAVTIALANIAVSWLGVMPLMPARVHPALRVELQYLHEQLEGFLRLPSARQNIILSRMKLAKSDDYSYKDLYAKLLNLAEPDQVTKYPKQIIIQDLQAPTCPQKAFSVALGVYISVSQAAFVEATYVGITRLFADPVSASAIASGSIAALFSAPPAIGLGYMTGTGIADALTNENKPLAKLYFETSRIAMQCAIDVLALFAGGTSFAFAMLAINDLTQLAKVRGVLEAALKGIYGTISYTTGAMFTAYYMLRLCDDILIYFAQRCTDEDIRRLFMLVMEARRMQRVLSETTEENYLSILRWKMHGNTELSGLLHAIFNERMHEAEYKNTQKGVNAQGDIKIMRDQANQRTYQTKKSFVEATPEWQQKHPGLRRRCCFFAGNEAEQEGDFQQSHARLAI